MCGDVLASLWLGPSRALIPVGARLVGAPLANCADSVGGGRSGFVAGRADAGAVVLAVLGLVGPIDAAAVVAGAGAAVLRAGAEPPLARAAVAGCGLVVAVAVEVALADFAVRVITRISSPASTLPVTGRGLPIS